jgi:hypothetical protein
MVMRKVSFIVFGLLTVSILLLALKVFAILYTSMPKADRKVAKNEDISRLIDDLIWEANGNRTKIYWTDSMEKLVELGESVVPDLVAAIETAHDKVVFGTYAHEHPSKWRIKYDTEMLQARAAMVLGRIGDFRSIPALTNLQCRDGRLVCYYVAEALKSIQENKKVDF